MRRKTNPKKGFQNKKHLKIKTKKWLVVYKSETTPETFISKVVQGLLKIMLS